MLGVGTGLASHLGPDRRPPSSGMSDAPQQQDRCFDALFVNLAKDAPCSGHAEGAEGL